MSRRQELSPTNMRFGDRHSASHFVLRLSRVLALTCVALFGAGRSADAEEFTEAESKQSRSDHAVVEALRRLPQNTLDNHPDLRAAVLRYMQARSGTHDYVELARTFGVYEETEELLALLLQAPKSNLNVEAAHALVESDQLAAIVDALKDGDSQAIAAAVSALGHLGQPEVVQMVGAMMLDEERELSIRQSAASGLGRTGSGQRFLLKLARNGQVPSALEFAVNEALLGSWDQSIQQEAAKYLKPASTAGEQALPPIRELAAMRGSLENGKNLFFGVATCSKCHKAEGEGKEVGPDLSEIGSKLSREDMYVAILNPNAAVSHNFETYALMTIDGEVLTGLLMNQTDAAATIRDAEGIDRTVDADEIDAIEKKSVSLMPSDLQKTMSTQGLVDLVDYLMDLKKPDEAAFQVVDASEPVDRSPDSAIAGFDIADGLQVELFAAEPFMLSPSSIDIDHLGRVWVCEIVNYRHFRNQDNEPREQGDRILVLEDTDQDGMADKKTVFYQGRDIDSPHGVCVLGEKVIVSAGENVIVFTDADGDLVPESQEVMFTGISGVQHDHGIHAFAMGPDGKLYFNFGNEGKQLKTTTGELVIDASGNPIEDNRNPYQQGMAFRCDLDGSNVETLGWNFRNNWELCVDSFGNIWQSDNDDDGNRGTRINFVMEYGNYGYRDEITGATWQTKRIGFESEKPLQHWHLNDPGVVPNILQTGAGSPTGIFFYEGQLLPKRFQNRILHTDPGPNVVRAYPVKNVGAGYTASIENMVVGKRDPWFRPVDVCAAPDGSLLIADWYDPGVGGHRMGDIGRGRLFRITPAGHHGYVTEDLDLDTTQGVIEALASPNLSTRYMAQQAMPQLGDAMTEALWNTYQESESDIIRARAAWQLARLLPAPNDIIDSLAQQENEQLRIIAVRIARQQKGDVMGLVQRLIHDQSAFVRRELLVALRHQPAEQAVPFWVELALQHDGVDRWYLEALGLAADGRWDLFLSEWRERAGDDWQTRAGADLVWRSRANVTSRLLVELIESAEFEQEQYRYFRALEFQKPASSTEALQEFIVRMAARPN